MEKPPLGIVPRFMHDEHRLRALHDAILRYRLARKAIPQEWLDEYVEIAARNYGGIDTTAPVEPKVSDIPFKWPDELTTLEMYDTIVKYVPDFFMMVQRDDVVSGEIGRESMVTDYRDFVKRARNGEYDA